MKKIAAIIFYIFCFSAPSFSKITNIQTFGDASGGIQSVFKEGENVIAKWSEKWTGEVIKTGGMIGGSVESIYIDETGAEMKAKINFKNNIIDDREVLWKYKTGKIGRMAFYDKGLKTGNHKWYFPNGKIKKEKEYKEDILDGKSRFYYATGVLKEEGAFIKGTRIGTKWYYPSGKKKTEEIEKDGLIYSFKYLEDGRLNQTYSRSQFTGLLEGLEKGYNIKTGTLATEVMYVNGKKTGMEKHYWSNGQLISETNYINGKAEGEVVRLDEQGKKEGKMSFKAGLPDGMSYIYDESGNVVSEQSFSRGKLNGPSKMYINGKLSRVSMYLNGDLIGETVYYPDGKKKTEKTSLLGFMRQVSYFPNGKIKEEGFLKEKDIQLNNSKMKNYVRFGTWKEYHENGKQAGAGSYRGVNNGTWVQDVKQPDWKYFDGNGKEIEKKEAAGIQNQKEPGGEPVQWEKKENLEIPGISSKPQVLVRKDRFTGKISESYDDGRLKKEMTLKKGVMDGPFTEYFKNGKIYKKGNYKDGKYDGEVVTYTNLGDVMDTSTYKNGNIVEKKAYKNGEKDGVWYDRYEGVVVRKITYKEGVADGPELNYQLSRETGPQLNYINWYSNGVCVKRINVGDNGIVTAESMLKDGKETGKKEYNENGVLVGEGQFKYIALSENSGRIVKDGKWKRYDDITGKLTEEILYEDGNIISSVLKNTKSGDIKGVVVKDDGKKISVIEYFDNGKIRCRGNEVWVIQPDGQKVRRKDGKWEFFNENGKKWKENMYDTKLLLREVLYDENGKVITDLKLNHVY